MIIPQHTRRGMKYAVFLPAILSILYITHDASAQCCAAGNPVNTNCTLTTNGTNVLSITGSFISSFSDKYYKGTTALDKRYIESKYDYSSLGFSYGISSKLRLTADIGYYFDKSQDFVTNAPVYSRLAEGISDATVGVNYSTYRSDDNLFELMQTAKVTIPVGEFEQEYDGIVLPIDFQPSSGNYRYNLGIILSKGFRNSDFSLMSFGSVEISQAIETSNTYHKYGNLYNVSLMGIYRILPSLTGFLQLRYEIRDRALNGTIDNLPASQTKNNKYSYINASGGVIAYISPQIALTVLQDWSVSLQYNYPFLKNIYGEEQLTNRHSISATISRSFSFGSGETEELLPEPDASVSRVKIHVAGNCDMCQARIQNAAALISDVQNAQWDPDTQILTVSYSSVKPNIDAIEKVLADVGHDTDHYKASDEVYNRLPKCCLYREK